MGADDEVGVTAIGAATGFGFALSFADDFVAPTDVELIGEGDAADVTTPILIADGAGAGPSCPTDVPDIVG